MSLQSANTKLQLEQIQDTEAINHELSSLLIKYKKIVESADKRLAEVTKAQQVLDEDRAKFNEDEKELIQGLNKLKADQKKVYDDQMLLDSQIKKKAALVEEAKNRATEAREIEDSVIEALVQSRISKMMKDTK